MNFIEVNGTKLAYLEKNKQATHTIFFIHGNSVSKLSWRKQYYDNSFSDYRLIALDLPGHGDSEMSSNPFRDYTLQGLASIMSQVIEKLHQYKPYVVAGLSVGTNIIAEMLAKDIKPAGLIFAGPSILNEECTTEKFVRLNTHVAVVFVNDADEDDVRKYGQETSASKEEQDLQLFLADYKATDKKFRGIFAQSIFEKKYSDELALVRSINVPCLIVFGNDEQVIDPDYLDNANLPLWKNEIFKLEGASHLVNIDQPKAFNELLKGFAEDIFK